MELRLDERLDHGVLDVLGPQLIRGKKIKLAQAMKAAPEGWAVKYVLMNQLVHERERRFAVPESECERPAQPSGRGGWRLPGSVRRCCCPATGPDVPAATVAAAWPGNAPRP